MLTFLKKFRYPHTAPPPRRSRKIKKRIRGRRQPFFFFGFSTGIGSGIFGRGGSTILSCGTAAILGGSESACFICTFSGFCSGEAGLGAECAAFSSPSSLFPQRPQKTAPSSFLNPQYPQNIPYSFSFTL